MAARRDKVSISVIKLGALLRGEALSGRVVARQS
jgi:hypothetical protein